MKRRILAAVAAAVCIAAPQARADVKPHALFSDGMVLQRGVDCPIWGTADPGEKVSWRFSWGSEGIVGHSKIAGEDGKWKLTIPKKDLKVGGPFTLTITGKNVVSIQDVYVGEVWICSGQSNMEWPLSATATGAEAIKNAKNSKIRLFTVPKNPADKPQKGFKGEPKWQECNPDTVKNFTAVGYFFGRDLQKALDVPVGLIHTSWGGTRAEAWTSRPVLESHEEWKDESVSYHKAAEQYREAAQKAKESGEKPPANPTHANSPSALYNGMIAPLIPYAIKGAIWYQGESNAGKAYAYRKLFPTMIQNWRDDWKEGDFTFLFVQLAPWISSGDKSDQTWAELREAQLLTTQKLKHAGMAVITDVGDAKDIHPRKKEPVGARLALAARAIAYGEKIEYSGPIYQSMLVEGDKAILTFGHVGKGLEAKGERLQGFIIAGEDQVFHPAQAEIKGDKVVVRSDKVAKPVAVRYGWSNNPTVNLWNKDGLPASPFRTDDFPTVTGPRAARSAT